MTSTSRFPITAHCYGGFWIYDESEGPFIRVHVASAFRHTLLQLLNTSITAWIKLCLATSTRFIYNQTSLALSLRLKGHPDRGSSLHNLAGALLTHYEHTGDVGAPSETNQLHQVCMMGIPASQAYRRKYLRIWDRKRDKSH